MTNLEDLPIRDDLKGLKPYGAPQLDVPIQLNVNENTFGIPHSVQDLILTRIGEILPNLNRYPDREFMGLREALAKYLSKDLRPEQIWAANGSNEVLQQIFQAFGGHGRTALGFEPTYSMYSIIAQITGTQYVAGSRGESFELTPQLIVEQIRNHRPDIVMLRAKLQKAVDQVLGKGHATVALASVIGPLFLTFTLTKWSGKALLEKGLHKTRPDYAAYVKRTSGFIPWPPKTKA